MGCIFCSCQHACFFSKPLNSSPVVAPIFQEHLLESIKASWKALNPAISCHNPILSAAHFGWLCYSVSSVDLKDESNRITCSTSLVTAGNRGVEQLMWRQPSCALMKITVKHGVTALWLRHVAIIIAFPFTQIECTHKQWRCTFWWCLWWWLLAAHSLYASVFQILSLWGCLWLFVFFFILVCGKYL